MPECITVDLAISAARKDALEAYLADHVWNTASGFHCTSAFMCRPSAEKRGAAFYEAQGQMVGPAYDLTVDGQSLRVLIIAMETGEDKQHRTVEQRTTDALKAAQIKFRQRNPHMRGVTFALRIAFGLPVDDDDAEYLNLDDGTRVQLLEAYAMANLLLCSAVVEGTMNSRSTGMMRASCSRHMRATIAILQPTLVISQGAVLDETLRASLGVTEPHTANLATCQLDGHRFLWASLRHPTRSWHSLKHPYLHEVVVPTITSGRELALRLNSSTYLGIEER